MGTFIKDLPISKTTSVLAALLSAAISAGCTTAPGKSVIGPTIGTTEDGFQRSVYGGVGLGFSHLDPNTGDNPSFDVNDRVGGAGQVTVGVDLTRAVSFEAHAADLGSAGLSDAGGADGSSQAGRLGYHMTGVSLLGYAGGNRGNDSRRGLTGFGRVGLVSVGDHQIGNTLDRIDSNPILVGVGLEYGTRSGLGFRAEVMANDSDIMYGQLGITYRKAVKGKGAPIVAAARAPVVQPPLAPPPQVAAAKAPGDSDLDGVYDSFDRCPKSEFYDIVDGTGCEAFLQLVEVVKFGWNSAELDQNARQTLDQLAAHMNNNPGASMGLAAHTDSTGPSAYNQSLSMRRATTVADYLRSRGVAKAALAISVEGEVAPTANNAHRTGRSENRRVELYANELPAHRSNHWLRVNK